MERLKIYLDNCCYNRPYDDQSQLKISLEAQAKLEIQQRIRDGKYDLVSSYILIAENSANPFEMKKTDIQNFIDSYTHTYVSENFKDQIKKIAKEIMVTGVKLMDACHVASAILAGCCYFITTDTRLLKYKSEKIKLLNPLSFILEVEEKYEP